MENKIGNGRIREGCYLVTVRKRRIYRGMIGLSPAERTTPAATPIAHALSRFCSLVSPRIHRATRAVYHSPRPHSPLFTAIIKCKLIFRNCQILAIRSTRVIALWTVDSTHRSMYSSLFALRRATLQPFSTKINK